jgi:hypothetical protein
MERQRLLLLMEEMIQEHSIPVWRDSVSAQLEYVRQK